MEFHDNWACTFVSNLLNNDSGWSVSKHSVIHDRHAAPCTGPHHAMHCTAQRESQHTRAWFRSCLFMCTLLELFSPRIWAPSRGGRVKIRGLFKWNQSTNYLLSRRRVCAYQMIKLENPGILCHLYMFALGSYTIEYWMRIDLRSAIGTQLWIWYLQ